MMQYVLMITSILTFLLNILLVCFLLKDKLCKENIDVYNTEVINFEIMPTNKEEAVDTQVLQTEILARGD